MFIGYFTERPYQDPQSGYFGATGKPIMDLAVSNDIYNPELGAELYNRYLDEKIYAEAMGFDGLMLNEHHGTPFCMGGAMNVEASILARITHRAKIVLLGNIIPIWDDPLWLVEQLAMIDLISRGRLVSGWVRGTGRESVAHNAPPHYNWERFQEAHEFIVKAWTTSGPFRWEGKHYHFRHVNPWVKPYQKPHPPIWLPGVVSRDSLLWAAKERIPYIMLATEMEPTKQAFQLYHDTAKELGYESGPQNIGYLWKVHVDETEELAEQAGRKYVQGPSNPFLAGNEGTFNPALAALPGLTSRTRVLPTQEVATRARGGAAGVLGRPYEQQIADYTIISGTPKTVLPKIRHVLEYIRPGSIFFWDGDGAMTHDDAMRSLRLMGEEVIPAIRDMATELDLPGPFEVDPATGKRLDATPAPTQNADSGSGMERRRSRRRGRNRQRYDNGPIEQPRPYHRRASHRRWPRRQHRRHHAGPQGAPSRAAGASPFSAPSHWRIAPPLQYASTGGAWRPACPSASGVPAQMGCYHGLGSRKNALELVFSRDEPEISAHLPGLAPTLRSVTPGQ